MFGPGSRKHCGSKRERNRRGISGLVRQGQVEFLPPEAQRKKPAAHGLIKRIITGKGTGGHRNRQASANRPTSLASRPRNPVSNRAIGAGHNCSELRDGRHGTSAATGNCAGNSRAQPTMNSSASRASSRSRKGNSPGYERAARSHRREARSGPLCFQLSLSPAPSVCSRVLIDIFLLSIVDPHKGFDRFDNSLSIPDQISIGILQREPIRKPA